VNALSAIASDSSATPAARQEAASLLEKARHTQATVADIQRQPPAANVELVARMHDLVEPPKTGGREHAT